MNYRTVQGASKPPVRGAEYSIKTSSVGKMPGPAVSDGQARSSEPGSIGGTRAVGAGGSRVSQSVCRPVNASHTKACGYRG